MTLRTLVAALLTFTALALNHPSYAQSNRAPVISGTPPATAVARTLYHFLPAAQDPDGQRLTYSINWKPAWAAFSSTTGRLTGAPGISHVGRTRDIVISVSDGRTTASLPAFAITVLASAQGQPAPSDPVPAEPPPVNPPPVSGTNRPPVITGVPPATAVARRTYHFKPVASDPEGRKLTYSISNKPAWAAFSSTTGRLTGAPGVSHVGRTRDIVISVSDGRLSTALPPFSITITSGQTTPANRPPVVSGTPSAQARVGAAYAFTPSGTDPDGDPLTWSISGKPPVASFSVATGRLQWTPTSTGTHRNIVITATDRHGASASLRSFNIAVAAAAATGSAALAWQAPTQYTNGNSLPASNLAGFRIYRGSSSGSLARIAEVDGRTTHFTVQDLARGTHYFAVTAVTTAGAESAYSAVGSKTIP